MAIHEGNWNFHITGCSPLFLETVVLLLTDCKQPEDIVNLNQRVEMYCSLPHNIIRHISCFSNHAGKIGCWFWLVQIIPSKNQTLQFKLWFQCDNFSFKSVRNAFFVPIFPPNLLLYLCGTISDDTGSEKETLALNKKTWLFQDQNRLSVYYIKTFMCI